MARISRKSAGGILWRGWWKSLAVGSRCLDPQSDRSTAENSLAGHDLQARTCRTAPLAPAASVPPKLAISDLIKGRSTHKVQREFPHLKRRYWGRHFWGRDYFPTTNGTINKNVVLQSLEQHIANSTDDSRLVTTTGIIRTSGRSDETVIIGCAQQTL